MVLVLQCKALFFRVVWVHNIPFDMLYSVHCLDLNYITGHAVKLCYFHCSVINYKLTWNWTNTVSWTLNRLGGLFYDVELLPFESFGSNWGHSFDLYLSVYCLNISCGRILLTSLSNNFTLNYVDLTNLHLEPICMYWLTLLTLNWTNFKIRYFFMRFTTIVRTLIGDKGLVSIENCEFTLARKRRLRCCLFSSLFGYELWMHMQISIRFNNEESK